MLMHGFPQKAANSTYFYAMGARMRVCADTLPVWISIKILSYTGHKNQTPFSLCLVPFSFPIWYTPLGTLWLAGHHE